MNLYDPHIFFSAKKLRINIDLYPSYMVLSSNPHNDQLSVGLIAQLMKHCTGIAEDWVRIPFRSESSRFFLVTA